MDDLLDVSRISTGRLLLTLETLDLASVTRDIVERHRAELRRAGCDVVFALQEGATGCWDRLRIEQSSRTCSRTP